MNTVDNAIKSALTLAKNAITSGSENHTMGAAGFVQRLCDRTSDPQQTKRDIWNQLSKSEREKFSALMPEDQKTKPTPQLEPPEETKQFLLNGEIYLTQLDLWINKIFSVGDRVISLIPGETGRTGIVKEINRVSPERIAPYDDLIVIWDCGQRDCLYFNQVGKRA